jgi:hypothetical protein
MVRVNADVRVAVKVGYDITNTVNEVSKVVTGMLVRREWGLSLRLSEVYDKVMDVDGVDYCYITLSSEPDRVNDKGDVVINDYEVIVRGNVIVSVIGG